ncbi:MAG: hypothetical protein IBX55_00585 [Methyloprofundus sp.]|nr:hypothetical protein [Methyloprofundus sp.]
MKIEKVVINKRDGYMPNGDPFSDDFVEYFVFYLDMEKIASILEDMRILSDKYGINFRACSLEKIVKVEPYDEDDEITELKHSALAFLELDLNDCLLSCRFDTEDETWSSVISIKNLMLKIEEGAEMDKYRSDLTKSINDYCLDNAV